jgi:hypothetical protein
MLCKEKRMNPLRARARFQDAAVSILYSITSFILLFRSNQHALYPIRGPFENSEPTRARIMGAAIAGPSGCFPDGTEEDVCHPRHALTHTVNIANFGELNAVGLAPIATPMACVFVLRRFCGVLLRPQDRRSTRRPASLRPADPAKTNCVLDTYRGTNLA